MIYETIAFYTLGIEGGPPAQTASGSPPCANIGQRMDSRRIGIWFTWARGPLVVPGS